MKRSGRIGMRVSNQDKLRWKEAASYCGLSLSAWIEANLNIAADKLKEERNSKRTGS